MTLDMAGSSVAVLFFNVLLATFCQIALGYILPSIGMLNQVAISQGLGPFIGKLVLPVLLFRSMSTIKFGELRLDIMLAMLIGKVIMFTTTFALAMMVGTESRLVKSATEKGRRLKSAALSALFVVNQNELAVGLPVIPALFPVETYPENFVNYLYVAVAMNLVIMLPIGVFWIEKGVAMETKAVSIGIRHQSIVGGLPAAPSLSGGAGGAASSAVDGAKRQAAGSLAGDAERVGFAAPLLQQQQQQYISGGGGGGGGTAGTGGGGGQSKIKPLISTLCGVVSNPLVAASLAGVLYNVVFDGHALPDTVKMSVDALCATFPFCALFLVGNGCIGSGASLQGRGVLSRRRCPWRRFSSRPSSCRPSSSCSPRVFS